MIYVGYFVHFMLKNICSECVKMSRLANPSQKRFTNDDLLKHLTLKIILRTHITTIWVYSFVLAYIYKAVYFIILSRTDLLTYCDIFSF